MIIIINFIYLKNQLNVIRIVPIKSITYTYFFYAISVETIKNAIKCGIYQKRKKLLPKVGTEKSEFKWH